MRNLTISVLMASGLALGACAGSGETSNRSVNSVNQPVVEQSQYIIDLNQAAGGLAGGEAARLDQWMQVLEVGYGDAVAIDAGGGPVSSSTRRSIASIAGQYGLILADYAPITPQPFIPGTVRVVVSRSVAYVPNCPDWDNNNSQANFKNATSGNYGCATNANRAAMIANPQDLVRGQKGEPSTRSGVEAIKEYREAGPRYGEGQLAEGASQSGGN